MLRLVAQGLTNAAGRPGASSSPRAPSTRTCASIYDKLGVDNRAAATRLAVEHGLA